MTDGMNANFVAPTTGRPPPGGGSKADKPMYGTRDADAGDALDAALVAIGHCFRGAPLGDENHARLIAAIATAQRAALQERAAWVRLLQSTIDILPLVEEATKGFPEVRVNALRYALAAVRDLPAAAPAPDAGLLFQCYRCREPVGTDVVVLHPGCAQAEREDVTFKGS